MANNRAGADRVGKVLARRRRELTERKEALGSYAALAKELGVNVSYVHGFIVHGRVPVSKQVRSALGIDVVSRGAKIYRSLSEKAKEKGWWVKAPAPYRAYGNGELPKVSCPVVDVSAVPYDSFARMAQVVGDCVDVVHGVINKRGLITGLEALGASVAVQ